MGRRSRKLARKRRAARPKLRKVAAGVASAARLCEADMAGIARQRQESGAASIIAEV